MIIQHKIGAQKVYPFLATMQVISAGGGTPPVAGSDVSNIGQEIGIANMATDIAFNITEIRQHGD